MKFSNVTHTKVTKIDEALFNNLFSQLSETNRINGTLVGRGQSATFIPRVYVLEQTREIKTRIEAQGHISLDELRSGFTVCVT